MTGKFVCRFCLEPIQPCTSPGHQVGVPAYCYGWVHRDSKTHAWTTPRSHSAQPVVA